MVLSARRLNRTLLLRQHLLARTSMSVSAMVEHLVGLQAQDNLPPYLGLAARLESFDPREVTRGLEDRTLVRLLVMRGTIHLLAADDAPSLRIWTQPCMDRERAVSVTVRPALGVDLGAFADAVTAVLGDGPLPVKALGEALAHRFPGIPGTALTNLAKVTQPLAQLPPRGTWKGSGGVVYQHVDRWLGRPTPPCDPAEIVRRYLRAFGPASAADVTAWSGVRGLSGLMDGVPDLVEHRDEAGRRLYDVADGELADEEAPAPVRLLGAYDNVWLSHAGRDRVTTPESRRRWMGRNGGVASTIFVDGLLAGLWRIDDGRPVVVAEFHAYTRDQRRQLDAEMDRVEALLSQ